MASLLQTVPSFAARLLFHLCVPQLVSQQLHTLLSPPDATHLSRAENALLGGSAAKLFISIRAMATNLKANTCTVEQSLCKLTSWLQTGMSRLCAPSRQVQRLALLSADM